MQLDARGNLVRVRRSVAKRSIDLKPGEDGFSNERGGGVAFGRQILDPHRDLPDVRSADQPGTAASRSIAERDQRVLVAAGAFLGVATEAIRKGFAGSPRPHAEALSKGVIQANGHIY